MSEKKKNRKSSRHFNLEKPVERHFEIEKDADIQEVAPIKPEGNKPQLSIPTTPEKKQEDIEKYLLLTNPSWCSGPSRGKHC